MPTNEPKLPACAKRCIFAMIHGVDKDVVDRDGNTIKAGTPLPLREAAINTGMTHRYAKRLFATEPAFADELKAETAAARFAEEPENLALLITTRDLDEDPALRLAAIAAIRPREPIRSIPRRSYKKGELAAIREQAQVIGTSPGAVIGAPQLPPSPAPKDFIPAAGCGSLANAEAARYEAAAKREAAQREPDPAVQAYTGPPCAPSLSSPIENAFKGESSRALRERFPPPPKPRPEPPPRRRLGGPRVW